MHEHVVCKSTIFFGRKDSWSHRGQAWVTAANSWGGIQITFCSFCNCLFILAQLYQKILALILMLKLLSKAAKSGCSERICSGHLTCSWTNQKSEPFYGYTCGCHFCQTFSIKSSVFFNKIVAYEEWLNCMVTLRTSTLKNEKPWQWQRKL